VRVAKSSVAADTTVSIASSGGGQLLGQPVS